MKNESFSVLVFCSQILFSSSTPSYLIESQKRNREIIGSTPGRISLITHWEMKFSTFGVPHSTPAFVCSFGIKYFWGIRLELMHGGQTVKLDGESKELWDYREDSLEKCAMSSKSSMLEIPQHILMKTSIQK